MPAPKGKLPAQIMNAALVAGLCSGLAGLLVFLTVHHFWIRPIWFIALPGGLIAALGGLVVGWSYGEVHAGLPPRPWTALALALLIGATLVPAIVVAELRAPLTDFSGGSIPPQDVRRVIWHIVLELLLTATMIGAVTGWWLGRSPRAAVATALAGLVFAMGPGHNIPLLGGTPAAGKGLVLLVLIVVVAAWVLVEVHVRLAPPA